MTELTREQRGELHKLIKKTARASTAYHEASTALNEFCEQVFGFAPADRDKDGIIDSIYGGCGSSSGISVNDFIKEMDS